MSARLVAVFALAAVSACHGSSIPTARAPSHSAIAQPDAAITISPHSDLRSGMTVSVRLHHFPAGHKVFLSECAAASDVNRGGCGMTLPGQPFGISSPRGTGTFPFTVSWRAATRPNSSRTVPCSRCVLVATVGFHEGPIAHTLAIAPLRFRHQ